MKKIQKNLHGNHIIIAQSCDSRECKKKFKDEITEICEAITTSHIINYENNTTVCLYCNKKNKIKK